MSIAAFKAAMLQKQRSEIPATVQGDNNESILPQQSAKPSASSQAPDLVEDDDEEEELLNTQNVETYHLQQQQQHAVASSLQPRAGVSHNEANLDFEEEEMSVSKVCKQRPARAPAPSSHLAALLNAKREAAVAERKRPREEGGADLDGEGNRSPLPVEGEGEEEEHMQLLDADDEEDDDGNGEGASSSSTGMRREDRDSGVWLLLSKQSADGTPQPLTDFTTIAPPSSTVVTVFPTKRGEREDPLATVASLSAARDAWERRDECRRRWLLAN